MPARHGALPVLGPAPVAGVLRLHQPAARGHAGHPVQRAGHQERRVVLQAARAGADQGPAAGVRTTTDNYELRFVRLRYVFTLVGGLVGGWAVVDFFFFFFCRRRPLNSCRMQ